METVVVSNKSAPVAEAVTRCLVASNKEKTILEMLRVKGTTLVMVERMLPFLNRYPDRAAARLLELDFTEGFWIPPVSKKLHSALLHPSVVSKKFCKEMVLGRMCGPFPFSR